MGVDTVHVWLVDADLPPDRLAELAPLLDGGERRRAAALRAQAHRHRFTVAHGATRVIVGDWLDAPPAALRWVHGPHGKPALAHEWGELQVNLSHSEEWTMVALTTHRPVGVDIQRVPGGQVDVTRLVARFFPAAEARFVAAARGPAARAERFARLWARKEALVKAAGGRLLPGLAVPVHRQDSGAVPVHRQSSGAAVPVHRQGSGAAVPVHDPSGALPGAYLVRDVPAPRGFRAAVALAGTEIYRISRHRWPDR